MNSPVPAYESAIAHLRIAQVKLPLARLAEARTLSQKLDRQRIYEARKEISAALKCLEGGNSA